MFSQNSHIRKINYSYDTQEKALKDLKLAVTAFKVEVHNQKINSTSTAGIAFQEQLVDGVMKKITTAGATNALVTTSGLPDLVIPSSKVYTLANSAFVIAQTGITISNSSLPELDNAIITLNFTGSDPSALKLPKYIYTNNSSGAGIILAGLPQFDGLTATTGFSGITFSNMGSFINNLPCQITYATKTGTSVKLFGNFPTASSIIGSNLVIPKSSSAIFAKAPSEHKQFVITAVDSATGTITIEDKNNLLKSIAFNATSNKLLECEIVNIDGFSDYDIDDARYFDTSSATVDISSFSPDKGDSFVIVEYTTI